MSLEFISWIAAAASLITASVSLVFSLQIFKRSRARTVDQYPKIVCDVCIGKGMITVLRDSEADMKNNGKTEKRIAIRCPKCGGSGYISIARDSQ